MSVSCSVGTLSGVVIDVLIGAVLPGVTMCGVVVDVLSGMKTNTLAAVTTVASVPARLDDSLVFC